MAANAGDWPQFGGPDRNSISQDTGLLRNWPDGGPNLLWTAQGCGLGFSGPAIAGGMIYTAGTFDKETYVLAFDLEGHLKWKTLNGGRWEVPKDYEWGKDYDGSRATPTVNDGVVYHLGELGRMSAFDASTGRQIWTLDIVAEFDAKIPLWGFSESVLVDGGSVIISPGGKKCYMAALDKKTGEVLWMSDLKDEAAANSSPILVEDHGIRQIITMTAVAVVGIEAQTGRLLWRHPHNNKYSENCLTPIYRDDHVFIASGYNMGCELLKLTFEDQRVAVERVWMNTKLDCLFGGAILRDGYLYAAGDYQPGWFCLDWKTGDIQWRKKATKDGAVTCADGLLYCLSPEGVVQLVEPSASEWKSLSEFTVGGKGCQPYFAHPVVCNGRLYIRHEDKLYCYDVNPGR